MKIALCAIAKNENRYIREWIEWYKNIIHINHIYLYDNNDIDGEKFDDVISDYMNDYVTVINFRGKVISCTDDKDGNTTQGLAYKDCYYTYGNLYDWICFFDIDEFLEFNNKYLSTILSRKHFDDTQVVHVPWKLYGDNNHIRYEDKPVIERFMSDNNWQINNRTKAIVRTGIPNLKFMAHGPLGRNLVRKTINGIPSNLEYTTLHYKGCCAYLMHFITKSTEEFFERKLNKTSAVTGASSPRNYNLSYLLSDNPDEFGYYKINKKTKEKTKYIQSIISSKIDNNIIVAVTSYKDRLNYLQEVLESITEQTLVPHKIVLTICNKDVKYMPKELKQFCKENEIEIIKAKEDLKPHKKYFYVMQKYRNNPIVTIDDDIIYTNDMLQSLWKSYIEYPNCISARRTHLITYTDKKQNPYKQWINTCKYIKTPSPDLFATTGAGTLFPPNILKLSDDNLEDIKKCLCADDIYLKWLENKLGIMTKYVPNSRPMGLKEIKNDVTLSTALWKTNVTQNRNDEYLELYPMYKEGWSEKDLPKKENAKSVLLCAIVKNENLYIEEWVKHYQNLGVNKIVIYDNDDVETEYIENIPYIKQLIDSKYIDVYHIPNKITYQKEAYTECYQKYNKEYNWLMFFDIDEYLMLENSVSINEELAKQQFTKYDMIHVNWKIYDDNNLIKCENNYSVVNRFTHPMSKNLRANREIKSIIRGNLENIEFTLNPHTVTNKILSCCDPLGNKVLSVNKYNNNICHKEMWLNHYICKTAEEFITIKLKRLGGSTKHEIGLRYNLEFFFLYNEKTPEKLKYFKDEIAKNFNETDSKKILKHNIHKLENLSKKPQTDDSVTIKIINKPTIVKTLEPYKLPVKSINRRY